MPELDRLKLLSKVDGAVLEAFCATYAEFVLSVRRGEPLKAAMIGQMRFYAGELGLTPAARARIATQLAGDSFEMVGFGQGFASMSSPTKELERRVLGGELNHGKSPVLR